MSEYAPQIRRGYLNSEDGQIHYRACGAGAPVVLLHLNPSSGANWDPVLPRLAARGYYAIAFDTPGYGGSSRPSERPDLAGYARRIAEAVTALGLRSYHLLGHHTGASIAAMLASTYPERIRRLVLWGYPMFSPEMMRQLAATPRREFTRDGQFLVERWQARWKADDPGYTGERNRLRILEELQAGPDYGWGLHALAAVDHAALARTIRMPTLVMCGERDTLWQESQDCVPLIPDARWIPIQGASIDVADEYPEEFVEAVDRFLRE